MSPMTMSMVLDRFLETLSEVTPESVWEWFSGEPLMVLTTIVAAIVLRWVLQPLHRPGRQRDIASPTPAARGRRAAPGACSPRPPAWPTSGTGSGP